jgi:hypothetical protein
VEKLNRKGIFFTIISVFLVTALLVATMQQSRLTLMQRESSAQTRVELANNYVKDLKQEYFRNAVYSSGFKALNLLSDYVATNGFFATEQDFANAFKELALTGKISGADIAGMSGYTLLDKFKAIEDKSRDVYAIDTWINITRDAGGNFVPEEAMKQVGLLINQTNDSGPFRVEVNFTVTFNVSLPEVRTSWIYQNESFIITFTIESIKDPLYLQQSSYENEINATKTEQWDVDKLYEHLDSMAYNKQQDAPSFLMRYYFTDSGDFSSECCGIESLVNPGKVSGIGDLEKTYADWCFYSTDKCARDPPFDTAGLWTINDPRFPSIFKLDSKHVTEYNVEDSVTAVPPP